MQFIEKITAMPLSIFILNTFKIRIADVLAQMKVYEIIYK